MVLSILAARAAQRFGVMSDAVVGGFRVALSFVNAFEEMTPLEVSAGVTQATTNIQAVFDAERRFISADHGAWTYLMTSTAYLYLVFVTISILQFRFLSKERQGCVGRRKRVAVSVESSFARSWRNLAATTLLISIVEGECSIYP